MKLRFIAPILVLGASCHAAAGDAPSPEPVDFLYAIRLVESGDRCDGPPGPMGELGAYQFRSQVWFQHTREPFAQARTAYADTVALQHYSWLAQCLQSAGIDASAWNMAAAWNCGVHSVRSGRIPRSTRDYAGRVQNLVEERMALRRTHPSQGRVLIADAAGSGRR